MLLSVPENEEIQCSANQNGANQSVAHVAEYAQQCGSSPADHQAQDYFHPRAAQNTIHVGHFSPLLLRRSNLSVQEQHTESPERKTGPKMKNTSLYFSAHWTTILIASSLV